MAAIAPDQLYVEFDVNTPEDLRTINFEGESLYRKSNEYNISVFNADGTPAQGTIQGIVTLNAYSPGADRARTTANTVDLSTGCRKFDLFFATIERAVFSVSGLIPGLTLRVSAFRTKGLIVGSNDLNTLDPVNLRQWTANYTGAGYVAIPEWAATSSSTVEFTIFLTAYNTGNSLFFDVDRTGTERSNLGVNSVGVLVGNFPNTAVEVNGASASINTTVILNTITLIFRSLL